MQTDDEARVERAISQFVPRLEAPEVRSNDSWIRVVDPVLDRDREAHGRFARELSERLGAVTVALALGRRGRSLSPLRAGPDGRRVPVGADLLRQLPKGDELALAANPTLVSRLTGADTRRRAPNRSHGATPADLPPAPELYEQIARLMGLEP